MPLLAPEPIENLPSYIDPDIAERRPELTPEALVMVRFLTGESHRLSGITGETCQWIDALLIHHYGEKAPRPLVNGNDVLEKCERLRQVELQAAKYEVADPAIAAMSLDAPATFLDLAGRLQYLVSSGRCTPDEAIVVAGRSESAQQTFIESREALPENTFDTGAMVDEYGSIRMNATPRDRKADRDTDFVFGKGRR